MGGRRGLGARLRLDGAVLEWAQQYCGAKECGGVEGGSEPSLCAQLPELMAGRSGGDRQVRAQS